MIYLLIADDRWYSDGASTPILASPDRALLEAYAEHLNRFKVFPPAPPGIHGEYARRPVWSHPELAERKRLLQEETAKIAPETNNNYIDWSSVTFEVEEVPMARPGLLDAIYGDLLTAPGNDAWEERLKRFQAYADTFAEKSST